MRLYCKLGSGDGRFLVNLKKRLVRERRSICAGCLRKIWATNLDVYVIDQAKPPEDKNLILLEQACRASIIRSATMLYNPNDDGRREWHKWVYGGHRNPLLDGRRPRKKSQMTGPDPYDYRAGSGKLQGLRVSHG